MNPGCKLTRVVLSFLVAVAIPVAAAAGTSNGCARFPVGSTISEPENLFSQNGVLRVNLTYQTSLDTNGNVLYCFVNEDGAESPTLHVKPGDTLILTVTNRLPPPSSTSMEMAMPRGSEICGAPSMNSSSVNVHYHGTNSSPKCGADEVIRTVINPGQSFTYKIVFPQDEPPGLYWYHPHIHGLSEAAVQGGASGAIVVDGIESIQPAVAGLPQRILLVRDNPLPGSSDSVAHELQAPEWDISLSYIPVPFPSYTPAVISIRPGAREFWRLGNLAADTILDVQLQYDGQPQILQLVGIDGVPVGSQDGTRRGHTTAVKHLLIPPAGRAEFIITGPPSTAKNATLLTRAVDTGTDGDSDPTRPIAALQVNSDASQSLVRIPAKVGAPWAQRFEGLSEAHPTAHRQLYFSEDNPDSQFFITVEGQQPVLFDPNNPPAIVTRQGSVEDWTIQNRTLENHEFHIHQIHFLLLDRNGRPVPQAQRQFLDTIDVPHWTGSGPYPSVTIRMDFRGPDVGDFVYHCHILEHEDKGMMAIIRVVGSSPDAAQP